MGGGDAGRDKELQRERERAHHRCASAALCQKSRTDCAAGLRLARAKTSATASVRSGRALRGCVDGSEHGARGGWDSGRTRGDTGQFERTMRMRVQWTCKADAAPVRCLLRRRRSLHVRSSDVTEQLCQAGHAS